MKLRWFVRSLAVLVCITLCTGMFHTGAYLAAVAQKEAAEVRLPILMYHHVLKEPKKQGKFVISPEEFRRDLEYLKKEGYTAITADALIRYRYENEPLPEKPVMLTFDDGYLSYLEYCLPLLEEFDMCAVVSIVGSYTDRYTQTEDRCVSYAHLNWEDATQLSQSTRTEIQNHTYDMHKIGNGRKGCAKKKGEGDSAYRALFCQDALKMRRLIFEATGKEANCFTYPFGYYCAEAEDEIQKMGFLMSLSCTEGINYLNRESSLFCLKRYNRPHGTSAEEILTKAK